MFSVIMPVWNRAYIVERAIQSVLSQTYKDYELIIVDDGSKDNLREVVQPYLSETRKYYKIPHRGLSAARNYGLDHSKGEFIAYLDSDNVWHSEFLFEMNEALNNGGRSEAAYCMFNIYKKDIPTGKEFFTEIGGREFVLDELFVENFIDINSFVHSRKSIKKVGAFDSRLKRLTDWDFFLRFASKFEPIFVQKVLVDYYLYKSEDAISLKEDFWKAYRYIQRKYRKPVRLTHDTIHYYWDFIPPIKYRNWVAMNNQKPNLTDYTTIGFPFILQIEPTNFCNLSCPTCPVGRKELNRKPEQLSYRTFKSLIDDMGKFLLFLVLWDWGEPFMNPELPEMINYASKVGIKTVTSTNAHFLQDREYVKKILTSGLSTLIVAIDSLQDDKYQIYRHGGNLEKAISGLKNVLKLKRSLKSGTLINLRMVIMKQNEQELKNMRRLAKTLRVDWFSVKTMNPSCGLTNWDDAFVPTHPRYRRYDYKKRAFERIRIKTHCMKVWHTCNILSNGDVVPCCYDFNAELKVGNIHEEPFSKIWNGVAFRELRRRIYHKKNSIPKCRECTINFKLQNPGWFVEYHNYNSIQGEIRNIILKILDKSLFMYKIIGKIRR